MFNPVSTYRIQFHKDFSFEKLEQIIPYLQQLGVTTLYASPVFEAVPGSTHGYDAVNPLRINPEVGTEESFRVIRQKLADAGIHWLQDIVPNHMAFDHRNPWLMDVLEKGEQSIYASFFDITWTTGLFKGKLMVPFLGDTLDGVIDKGELKLSYEDGRFVLKYYESWYPLKIYSYLTVLGAAEGNDATKNLAEQIDQIHQLEESSALHTRWNELLLQMQSLMKNEVVRNAIQEGMEAINNDKEKIRQLAGEQYYRLCHWQETDERINYRRFFTVNGLICLNIQDPKVLEEHHRFIRQMVDEGLFQGLRIDHIDGLYNPTEYLHRLRAMSGDETYIIVEKILEPGEDLPSHWPIQGNTGYDFLSMVNNLFTRKESAAAFTDFYEELTGDYSSIHQQLHNKKSHILYEHMGGELENLYQLFLQLNLADKRQLARIPPDDLKSAIGEFLIQCPVYRFYGDRFPLSGDEEKSVRDILQRLRKSGESHEAVSILENVLLHRPHENNAELNDRILQYYQRMMQFTGPLMAKGVEDTLMYTYNRFIGHNEVGDSPEAFGNTAEGFHRKMLARKEQWPLSLNATSTHDTKRGEDTRARLNVITDLHEEWLAKVTEWREMNKALKKEGAPDDNDEYFVYQALVGNFPMPGEDEDDFINRIQAYIQKALREAKVHSNWTTPNTEYEEAVKAFAVALLDKSGAFWKSFTAFQDQVIDHGIINSLSQVVLKFTCPGVPDVYQGCEFWDFSYVDPDNRRPVNFEKRLAVLQSFEDKSEEELFTELWEQRYNAQVKLWLTQELFRLRKSNPDLFAEGEYIPLHVEGTYKNHVLAFARRHKTSVQVVAVPLHTALLCKEQGKSFFEIDWKDTRVTLPKEIESSLETHFTRTQIEKGKGLLASELFSRFPIAILKARQETNVRGAGVLLHISSLPSPFGIGDMGPEAKHFADFLYRTRQKYWQLLPLNPTEEGQGYSPYSALSSKAGYPLLISPELLVKDGLLQAEDLRSRQRPRENHTDFREAEKVKEELFEKAFSTFLQAKEHPLQEAFKQFTKKEKEWLDDFALFMQLKKVHEGRPWFDWPDEYKKRDEEALKKFAQKHSKELKKIKWLQFVFARQWHDLRSYCNSRNIQFIGDLPFYISYDSSDVWAEKEIFAIDADGRRTGMAGVPPDAFSDDGQLWGMPVFKWDVLKENGYAWWIGRLRKNIELFDLVRLDHFRAFAAYWEVPEGEQTAKNGKWIPGPGADFFQAVETALGELPFVAEDLGDIDADVLNLRDAFRLPGMKVLQFAFGGDMPQSDYIPHNYEKNFLVYTGTHDNNTTVGWFRTEAGEDVKNRIRQYAGADINESNIYHVFARLAYGSVASIAILPIQDVLGLDESARMNVPSSAQNNWSWRLTPGQLNQATERLLLEWTRVYNRD
ncbi:MAG TPA: malto-oligosyltrehalose synthase [Flavisolibacter sp.]|jgi:malto-oligosyltrehalose synthase/4-alpha-glucanotransferase|nr:malto-oligosyltrehalose synthase [Flavisolibacter sp.]